MKIGFITTYFHPFKDGTENNCLYLASELAKKHEVHIFTNDRRNGVIVAQKEEVYKNLHIHRCRNLFRYKYYLVFDWDFMPKIMKYELDILHVHSIGFIQHDIAVLLKKLFTKTRIVNTPHGPFLANENYNIIIKALRNLYRFIEFPINRFCYDASIRVNTKQQEWMVKYGFKKDKIRYNPDGIPRDRFRKINNSDFIKKYKLKNKIVISSLGRLLPYKGFDQIIKALPSITKKHKNIVYLCMGEDRGFLKELKQLVRQNKLEKYVIFTGEVSEDDKLKGLDASEIFVFPSEPGTEAFGIVTLEAMARNNAVIASNTEGSFFLLEKNKNALFFNYEDIKTLEKQLLTLIQNKKLRSQMKKNNHRKAGEFINEDITWSHLEKIYREITG